MKKKLAKVIWFTGLSGSGKTTLTNSLRLKLKKLGFSVEKVDGDTFRKKTKNKNNFTKKNILVNHKKIMLHIKRIENKFNYILVAVISPLLSTRKIAKKYFGKRYFEIFVKCSLKELIRRDTKGLYKKAKEKKISNLVGYNSSIKFEKSRHEKITIDTEKLNIFKSTRKILSKIQFT